jgi:hypothetical protein
LYGGSLEFSFEQTPTTTKTKQTKWCLSHSYKKLSRGVSVTQGGTSQNHVVRSEKKTMKIEKRNEVIYNFIFQKENKWMGISEWCGNV